MTGNMAPSRSLRERGRKRFVWGLWKRFSVLNQCTCHSKLTSSFARLSNKLRVHCTESPVFLCIHKVRPYDFNLRSWVWPWIHNDGPPFLKHEEYKYVPPHLLSYAIIYQLKIKSAVAGMLSKQAHEAETRQFLEICGLPGLLGCLQNMTLFQN